VGVDIQAVVAVLGNAVEFVACLLDGINMHHHRREIAQMVEQLVTHLHRDGVAFRDRMPRSDSNAQVGVQAMTEPARAHVGHLFDSLRTARCLADFVDDGRLDAIQHARKDRLARLPHDLGRSRW